MPAQKFSLLPPPSTSPMEPGAAPPSPVLGIDVSKLTLDTCLLHRGQTQAQRFANTPAGHAQLLALLQSCGVSPALVAMEATGPYSLAVAQAAWQAGHEVAVINPRRVLDYARATERRNKTDRADAALIARFAAKEPLPRWQPLPAAQHLLRELLRRQRDLQAQLHAEERRLEVAPEAPALRRSLTRAQTWLRAELARLEKSITAHLAKHPALAHDIALVQSIPGFGQKSARLLAAEIPRHFANARALCAWLRVVPQQCTSGSSIRKPSRIGYGAPGLRSQLYFAAVTATRFEPRSKAFAERLRAAGKSKMSILFAVLHKLVRTAFAILHSGQPYQPDHQVTLATPCSP